MFEGALTDDQHHISAFIGFEIPPNVYGRLQQLVRNLKSGSKEHQGALYAQVVLDLVEESLQTFFLRPLADVPIGQVGEQLVRTSVAGVQKAVAMLVNMLSKKLTNEEMVPLADYLMQVIYEDLSRPVPADRVYMASPISKSLDYELDNIVKSIEAGATGSAIEERLTRALLEVSEIALDIFFSQPLNLLNLGMVMRKTSQLAFEGTRMGIRKVIQRVFRGMDERGLRGVAQYIRSVKFSRSRFFEN